MFNIAQKPSYTAQVDVKIPGDKGQSKKVRFNARFRRLSTSEIEALYNGINEKTLNDEQIVKDVMVGWDGVEDDDGQAVEFNEANLDMLLDIHPVRPSIVRAFFASIQGADAKN